MRRCTQLGCELSRFKGTTVSIDVPPEPEVCACLAVRQAARHITQFYDHFLAPTGLRTTQFSILAKLRQLGPVTINELAAALVMDRTTLSRNILPLEREGLISIEPGRTDRRSKEVQLTSAGTERLRASRKARKTAQARFAAAFGEDRVAGLHALLHAVTAIDLPSAAG